MLLSYLQYRLACRTKQNDRQNQIATLPLVYHSPLTPDDIRILDQPASKIIEAVNTGQLSPKDILVAYGKKALQAQEALNCLSEVLIPTAETWAAQCNTQGPLAGIPVSLKDVINVKGYDSCIGFAAYVGKPATADAVIVKLLLDAGAIPFVKTTVPITLMSYESASDVIGVTENPHKKGYAPGGSSGGEAALIAYGGSRIGIGSDGAGSVRVPSHYSGVYTIKASTTRFVRRGDANNHGGQEGVLFVFSPMARTLDDLETIWKGVMAMDPWKYDHTVINLPWRKIDLTTKKIKWGVMWSDGVVTPSPACTRALREVVTVLKKYGFEVVTLTPPSPYEGFKIASQLLVDELSQTDTIELTGESNDPGMVQANAMYRTPRWVKRLYAGYLRYLRGDEIYAGLVEGWFGKTAQEYFALVAQREEYRARWFQYLNENEIDFILTCPNAMPAVPHGGMKDAFTNCLYALLFNMLDYSAGVLPVTHVDRELDILEKSFRSTNVIERGAYKHYNAEKMHGLPIGVQIVGRRLEEEKVLEGMKIVETLLKKEGNAYELLRT
ncbi:amidase signature enzyme [Neolentinus lepideus HHB14362 ss-1]|uniref:amidase n=1 Tax=Neolentinus lepideus HHB14362 ss-1 TaxID=1314782 RepID=A0A165PEG8_9AGAM|nr:amidase signature enzyme [Neolentinus lepideus HHB14362 ss-1]